MSDQNFVKKHLEALMSAQLDKNERKGMEILEILENHFDGTLSLPEINHSIQLMLQYGHKEQKISLLNFLANSTENTDQCLRTILNFIRRLTSVYPEQVKCFSEQWLVEIALLIIESNRCALDKQAAARTIAELLKMNAIVPEFNIGKIVDVAIKVLNQPKKSVTVQEQLFLITGTISKFHTDKFPPHKAVEFRNLAVSTISSSFKDDKASFPGVMISGAIEGLNMHLLNFTPTLEEDPTFAENLYEAMEWMTNPKKAEGQSRRDPFRKMLSLITEHSGMREIPIRMFHDYKKWQKVFLSWISSQNYDDQSAGVQAIQTFHERIAGVLEQHDDPADATVLDYFLNYYESTLQNQNSQPHEIRIAIRGFGAMAAACKLLKGTNYLSQLFDLVMQRTEYSYYTNDRDERRKVLEHLPSFVESLSKIMNHLDAISSIQLQSLQSVMVVLIKDFHFLPTIYHSVVATSLMETFLNVQKSGEKVLRDVVDDVIRRGILYNCSRELTYDVHENIDKVEDWKDTVTYRNYLPLWNRLFTASKPEYESISVLIFQTFVSSLYEIIEKLELSTRKRTHAEESDFDYFFNNPMLDVEPVEARSFQILYNLVQFYGDVFKGLTSVFLQDNFSEWLEQWLEDTIRFSIQNPLVSAFLQILEVIVHTMEKLGYNDEARVEKDSTMMKNIEILNFFIRTSIFVRLTQFYGELQISCLKLVFQLPISILKNLINDLPPIFIIGFTIGRAVLPLANSALSCFERIVNTLTEDLQNRQKLLVEVLPCLESFLSSHDTGSDEIRKMVRRGKKTRLIEQSSTAESDLMRFKKRILRLLGNFDLDEAQLILSNFEPKLVRNFYTSVLEIKLQTNEDSFPQIYLDDSIKTICELALTSSERSSRVTACELLHCLAVYMIGKSLDGPETLPLWSEICRSLFLLAADKDETIRQMIEPLLKQIIHYSAQKDKISSRMTKVLIETLMKMISCQSNSSVQDLSALLLNEFLQWVNRQCDRSEQRNAPMRPELLFHEMRKMSLETDESRRMGATMAFNNIYKIIREDEEIVDTYWIYLLEVFCTNFKNSEDFGTLLEANFVDGRRYEQITSAMEHITRVFVERSNMFHLQRDKRLQPDGFEGTTLSDVLKWLFAEAGQPAYFYRHKCMKMFLEILPECGTKAEFFENHLNVERVAEIAKMKSVDLSFLKESRHQDYRDKTSNWMSDLLRSVDFLIWICENEIVPENLIEQLLEKSNILVSLEFFLCEVVLQNLGNTINSTRPKHETSNNGSEQSVELRLFTQNFHNIGAFRCMNLVRMIDFLTISCRHERVKTFLLGNVGDIVKLTKQLIFNPQKRGFDHKSKNPVMKLPERVIRFIAAVNEHAPQDVKRKLLDVIEMKFFQHLNTIFNNFMKLSNEKSIDVAITSKLNGIELVVSNVQQHFSYICIEQGLDMATAEMLIMQLFNKIVEKIHDENTPKHLTPAVKQFLVKILSLCFKIDNFITKIIELILNQDVLKTSNTCQVLHGEKFLETFRTSIFNHFVANLPETVDSIMRVYDTTIDPAIKFKIISILSDLNQFILEHYSTNERVLTRNLDQMVIYGPKIISTALELDNTLNRVDLTLIDLLSRMAMVCPIELVEFGGKLTPLEGWLLDTLEKRENSLELKSKMLGLMPLITSVNDVENNKLTKALGTIQRLLPMKSAEFKEGSVERATLANFSKELFKALLISRSPIIYEFIIVMTVSDDEYFLESKLQQTQCELMENYLDADGQENIMNYLFEAFAKRQHGVRLSFVMRYFQNIMKSAKVDVIISFVKSQIENILKFAEEPYKIDTVKVLMNRCVGYQIIEAFYASVSKDQIYSSEFTFKGKTVNGNDLTKSLIKKFKQARIDGLGVEDDHADLFRRYQCFAYRALAAIICNTQIAPEIYYGYLFKDTTNYWYRWIDIKNDNLFGEFKQEFDDYPKLKEYITSVKGLKTAGQTQNYHGAVSIFDKSLSQSLTKNDLTYSVVLTSREVLLNAQIDREQERQSLMTIRLESTPINDHELMPALVGVVKHIYNNKISPTENLNEVDKKKYKWVEELFEPLQKPDTHKNIVYFLLKLVDNCHDIFQHYAQLLFESIISVISKQKYFDKMSYFLTDLISMLLSWSSAYTPSKSSEINDIRALFKFLIANAYHERNEVFRLNLALVQKVCETWKEQLKENIPSQLLLDSLDISLYHRLRCGIQINNIVLVNDLMPWTYVKEQTIYIDKLMKCLLHENSEISQPAAYALGKSLSLIQQTSRDEAAFEDFIKQITGGLERIKTKLENAKKFPQFLQILYGIQKSFPVILDDFLTTVKLNIPSAIKNVKRVYLEMYLSRLEKDGENVYREIKSFRIKALLNQTEFQLHALLILNKSIDHLTLEQTFEFLEDLKNIFRSLDDEVRKLLVEVLINIHEKFKKHPSYNRKLLLSVLLRGFTDTSIEIQNRIINFFYDDDDFPKQTIPRFLMVLEDLYVPELEKEFLNYATILLLDISVKHPKSKLKLLDYDATKDRDYNEFIIPTTSSYQRSFAPMFIPSSQSRLKSGSQMIQATEASGGGGFFAPTQDPIEMSRCSQTFQLKDTQKSLLFSVTPQYLDRKSNIVDKSLSDDLSNVRNEQIKSGDMTTLDKLRKRIMKQKQDQKSETSRMFARKAVDYRSFKLAQEKQKMKRLNEGREVKLYRRYRAGDFPDFFFTSLSMLLPLQALLKREPAIARDVLVNIFESLVEIVADDKAQSKLFYETINRCVMKILQTSKETDPFLIATLLHMVIKSGKYLEISPIVLTKVVKANNLMVSGIVFMEHQLKLLLSDEADSSEPLVKRRRNQEDTDENEKMMHWMKVIDLLYKIREYETIQGIFTDKLNLPADLRNDLMSAVELESSSQYREASRVYERIVKSQPADSVQADVYRQSFYNCLENLADWSEISNSINSSLQSYKQAWEDGYRETVLPHLLKTEVRLLLSSEPNEGFINILEDWLNDEDKCSYIKDNFPEQVVMTQIYEKDFTEALVEVERALKYCAEEWSCLERIDEKLVCLRESRNLAELNNFTYMMTTTGPNHSSRLNQIIQNWKISRAKPSDNLNHWRDLISVRKFCTTLVDDDVRPTAESHLMLSQLSFVDVVFMQKNCDTAEFLMKNLRDELRSDKDDTEVSKTVKMEKILKYYLAQGKHNLMKSEVVSKTASQQVEDLEKGFKYVDENIVDKSERYDLFPKYLVEGLECASEISWKLCQMLKNNPSLQLKGSSLSVADRARTLKNMWTYSNQTIVDAVKKAKKTYDENYVNSLNESLLGECYLKMGKFYHQTFDSGFIKTAAMQHEIFKAIFRAISCNVKDARYYLPFILDLPDLKNNALSSEFNEQLNSVEIWMFIPYISQILSNYDFENECYLDNLLETMATKYPNALYFPFKLSLINYRENVNGMMKPLIERINSLISSPQLDKFVKAIECLVLPERLVNKYLSAFNAKLSTGEIRNEREFKEELRKLQFEAFEKNSDVKGQAFERMQAIRQKISSIENLSWNTNAEEITNIVRQIHEHVKHRCNKVSSLKLVEAQTLSKFFEDYRWNGGNDYIEIPGQYTGESKPFVEKHVKIVRFNEKLKVFTSKQMPIELKIFGSDGKVHSFIVKFGEDLRLDQRIQQVLHLMSRKLAMDKNCTHNQLQIQTYNVIPINLNCGMLSVVENAITLTEFLDDACNMVLQKTYTGMDNAIRVDYRSFLMANESKSSNIVDVYHRAVKNFTRQQFIDELSKQERKVQLDIFHRWFMQYALSLEAYYILRKNFINSLSTLNVGHFILGIGDRHLGNTLINKSNAKMIGIDFGIAFSAGLHLDIPELVPCRLTSHFVYVIEPHGVEGIIKRNMTHAMRCLRDNKETILICLEMFIKEPTMDWLLRAKSKSHGALMWVPEQRINTVKLKLNGVNPAKIAIDELANSAIALDPELLRRYQSLVRGSESSKRSRMKDENLSAEDQITAVIEMATDKALLATLWIGWDQWL